MAKFPPRMMWASGGASVEMSPEFARVFERALQSAAPETIEQLTKSTDDIYAYAREFWPRGRHRKEYKEGRGTDKRKAHSRDQLERGIEIRDGGRLIVGFVRNPAWWSWAIRWGVKGSFGFRRGSKVGRDLILRPGRKQGPVIAKVLSVELANAAVGKK